jgi:hypothetical protein
MNRHVGKIAEHLALDLAVVLELRIGHQYQHGLFQGLLLGRGDPSRDGPRVQPWHALPHYAPCGAAAFA